MKFALGHFLRGHLLDQQTIESLTMCSLLQPIVLRDVLHVVRHGALHIFRALLSTASADMVSCLPSIWFLSLQQLAEAPAFL